MSRAPPETTIYVRRPLLSNTQIRQRHKDPPQKPASRPLALKKLRAQSRGLARLAENIKSFRRRRQTSSAWRPVP